MGSPTLADRLVLDAEDPGPVWARVAALAERTATSDLRWTRLTRWRALMAHFWDIPEVRAAAPGFNRLRIEGSDLHAARLYAAWLHVDPQVDSRRRSRCVERPGGAAIECVEAGGRRSDARAPHRVEPHLYRNRRAGARARRRRVADRVARRSGTLRAHRRRSCGSGRAISRSSAPSQPSEDVA